MADIKVELKKVSTFQGHDGVGFNADVWINGIECMHAYDGAYGGCVSYTHNLYNNPKADNVRKNIQLFEDHIATLPDYIHPAKDGRKELVIKMDMDMFIEGLLAEDARKKDKQKILRNQVNHFIYGFPDADSYNSIKCAIPIAKCNEGQLRATMSQIIKAHFKEGYVFYNTNLPII
jgi:hypothetical protein